MRLIKFWAHLLDCDLQLEEQDAVEGVAHVPGKEEVAKQMKVGL